MFDKEENKLEATDVSSTSGTLSGNYKSPVILTWNNTVKYYKGTVKFKIKKGDYYLRLENDGFQGTGNIEFKATYPNKASDKSVKTQFTTEMKKGDTIQLGTLLSAETDDNVMWKSSKTSVAKVSATGQITAKSKGTATITASIGDSSLKIQVNVK